MKTRLLVAVFGLVVAGSLPAFAPAPFPRTSRRKEANEISVATFQGTWRVAGMMHTKKDGTHRPYTWSISHVRVDGKTWTFLDDKGTPSASYTITIDNSRKPAAYLDFWNGEPKIGEQPPGGGIIRRKGEVVEIIYVFGGRERPISFEQPPDGQYLLTLHRQHR